MDKNNLLLILLAFLFLACTKTKTSRNSQVDNNSSKVIVGYLQRDLQTGSLLEIFDLSDFKKTTDVKASEIGVENIQYIPMDHKNNGLLGYIKKIIANDNSFYIASITDIKRFNSNGKFITKIGKQGRGPTEYLLINDFSIGPDSNVYVLSRDLKKIFVYSCNNEFIKTIPAPVDASDLCVYEGGIICYNTDIPGTVENSFHLIDYNGKVVRQIPNKYKFPDRIRYAITRMISFSKNSDGLYFKEQISDTIFKLSEHNLEPKFVINRGEKLITRKLLSNVVPGGPPYVQDNYIVDFQTIVLNDYIYLESLWKNIRYGFFANIKDSVGYLMNLEEHAVINDYDGGPDIFFRTGMRNNTILCWIDAYELIDYVNSDSFRNSTPKFPEKKEELKKLVRRLDKNDNPVFMLVKLKE